MSQAAAVKRAPDNLGKSMTAGKFAMWAFLCSDGMGFACLFAAYFATRAKGLTDKLAPLAERWWPDATVVLDVDLTALNTFILICSSVTMVWAESGRASAGRASGSRERRRTGARRCMGLAGGVRGGDRWIVPPETAVQGPHAPIFGIAPSILGR